MCGKEASRGGNGSGRIPVGARRRDMQFQHKSTAGITEEEREGGLYSPSTKGRSLSS